MIKKGKVKDIYEFDNEKLLFHFTDRISAFDIIMKDTIPYKGKVLCDFAVFWFSKLKVANHYIKKVDKDKIIVKKLSMIPLECISRGYFYGSLYSRYVNKDYSKIPNELLIYLKDNGFELGSKLPIIIFDPYTKSDLHDEPIDENHALIENLTNKDEFDKIKSISLDLYNQMTDITKQANFILADVKFEFGIDLHTKDVLLADSIGPDECRLWNADIYQPGKQQDSFDKQILRDWLFKTGFVENIRELAKDEKPNPPHLPDDIINKISDRYIEVYEKITNTEFQKL